MSAQFLRVVMKHTDCEYYGFEYLFTSMNISFAVPNTDECDDCVFYSNAGKDNANLSVEWENHKQRPRDSCQLYREDSNRMWPADTVVFAVDLDTRKLCYCPECLISRHAFSLHDL